MPQFDVYINPSSSTRDTFPFVVDIQNLIISEIATRIVIPLGRVVCFKNEQMKGLICFDLSIFNFSISVLSTLCPRAQSSLI